MNAVLTPLLLLGDRGLESHGAPHGYYAAPPHDPHSGGHGYDSHSGGHGYGYDSHGGHGHDGHYEEHTEKKDKKDKKKDSGNTDMLVAGAAGLVIGGAAGALIAHEMSKFAAIFLRCMVAVAVADGGCMK